MKNNKKTVATVTRNNKYKNAAMKAWETRRKQMKNNKTATSSKCVKACSRTSSKTVSAGTKAALKAWETRRKLQTTPANKTTKTAAQKAWETRRKPATCAKKSCTANNTNVLQRLAKARKTLTTALKRRNAAYKAWATRNMATTKKALHK